MSAAVSVCLGSGFTNEVEQRAYRFGIDVSRPGRWLVHIVGVILAEAVVDDFGTLVLIRDSILLQSEGWE